MMDDSLQIDWVGLNPGDAVSAWLWNRGDVSALSCLAYPEAGVWWKYCTSEVNELSVAISFALMSCLLAGMDI